MTQVGRAIINEGGAPTGVACIGDAGSGTGDIKLVAGRGPGPDRFQGRNLYSQVHTEGVSSLAKGKRIMQGYRTHWVPLEYRVRTDKPQNRGGSQLLQCPSWVKGMKRNGDRLP